MTRIPGLPELASADLTNTDYFVVYDSATGITYKLSKANLVISLAAAFGSTFGGTLTGSKALYSIDANTIGESAVTSTELGYLSGVTSALQTQIDAISGGGSGSATNAVVLTPTTAGMNVVQPGNATSSNLILRMVAGQTEPPLRVESSAGTLLLSSGTNGQLVSAVTTGTAPFSVDSTTEVANLNVAKLQGNAASAFAAASHTHANTDITGFSSAALVASTSFALTAHTHGLSALAGDTYSAGQIIRGTGAGGLLSKLDLGTTGQVLTATSGTGLTWTTPSAGGGGGATSATAIFPATALFSVGTNGASLLNLGDATTARMVRGFDDTTECYACGTVGVPSNIDTSGNVSFTAIGGLRSSTTGNLLWTFGERESTDTESWTGAYTEHDSASTAISGATTTQRTITWSVAVSTLGWANGDIIRFRVSRDPGVSGDATGDAVLDAFHIQFPLS